MKISKAVMFTIMLLFLPAYAFSANSGYMRISHIEGDVQIMTPESGDWGPASINGPLAEGDQVWIPQGSRVELQLNNGSYIRLDQTSALQILSVDEDSSQFYLAQGRAYINYYTPGGGVIQFDTPDASTRAFSSAVFRIDITGQYTDISVYKGYVESENTVGLTRINAGEMLSIGRDTNGEIASIGPADEWEIWNKSRDRRISAQRGAGYRYLPAELRPYSYDFDNYGRWVNVHGYGHCWTPTVFVGVNWAPYRSGRWIWRHGDYVWVPFEPWGWAPYHYGRWAYFARIGWCWVPPAAGSVYWGPGYVGWVRTPDYVAWVPLAPGETYYGRGYYGPHSINITNININQVKITNVYKNVNINNAVTVVNRRTFNTASPTTVSVNRNTIREKIFTRNNLSPGAPAIRPTRASYFASSKPVQPAKLPPRTVRNIKAKELKQSRPFVRTPGRSALNPGAGAAALPITTVPRPRTPGREQPALRKLQPTRKEIPVTPAAPKQRIERPQVQPTERAKPSPAARPIPESEKPRVQPEKRERPVTPAAPQQRIERPQVQPTERAKPAPGARPQPGSEKPRIQPEKRERPVTPTAPHQRMERPQVQPSERAKPAPAVVPKPPAEKPQAQPEKKMDSEKPDSRGRGDGRRPGEPAQGPQKDR